MTKIRLGSTCLTFLTAALLVTGCAADGALDATSDDGVSDSASQLAAVLAEHPEAQQISANQIAWDGGKVVMTFPDETTAAADTAAADARASTWHGCPKGWYCFYAAQNFGGRRLQFHDCAAGGTTQFLTDYGFGDVTTSWVVNRSLNFVNVNDDQSGWNLWNEDGNAASSNVGAADNDKADWFICYG